MPDDTRALLKGKARLVDTSKCMGCRACQVACKQWNELSAEHTLQNGSYENPPRLSGSTWIKVQFREEDQRWLFRVHTCMHCTNASCESVCPTGAISHNGAVVVIDQDWCIGCGYCVQACPFGVVHRDEVTGTARKCTFCLDRISNGMEPACAKTCPPGALQFGERTDMLAVAHLRVQYLAANGFPSASVYGEKEVGGLHVIYVLTEPPATLGLPQAPRVATSRVGAQWLSGFITAGVVAAIPFWFLFRRRAELETEKESAEVGGVKK